MAKTATLDTVFNALAADVEYLANRWRDESGYENISEYEKFLNRKLRKFGLKVDRMSKRPFGFEYVQGRNRYYIRVQGRQIVSGSIPVYPKADPRKYKYGAKFVFKFPKGHPSYFLNGKSVVVMSNNGHLITVKQTSGADKGKIWGVGANRLTARAR